MALYEEARGFIHMGEEDFGITMVEALAAGTPVIALNRGGARDIVRQDVDGLLFDEPDVASLRRAVVECAERMWDSRSLALRAQQFSRERFALRFLDHLRELGVT